MQKHIESKLRLHHDHTLSLAARVISCLQLQQRTQEQLPPACIASTSAEALAQMLVASQPLTLQGLPLLPQQQLLSLPAGAPAAAQALLASRLAAVLTAAPLQLTPLPQASVAPPTAPGDSGLPESR